MTIRHDNFFAAGGNTLGGAATDIRTEIFERYDIDDIKTASADSIILLNINYLGEDSVAIVGTQTETGIMNNPSDKLALPCPPHCSKGGLVTPEHPISFENAKVLVES